MSGATETATRSGFEAGFEKRDGDRTRRPRPPRREEKNVWVPCTKLGRLVKDRKIRSIDEIFLFSLQIKEYQIVDHFFPELEDSCMKISPVQKQTSSGQRTRFKAWIIVGDRDGHVGLGVRTGSEASGAIRGAIISAKLNLIPVRRGYWGSTYGAPHTVPCKVSAKCGSVRFRVIPAPRGTGIVAATCVKKLLTFAGIHDAYTTSRGETRTMGNFLHAAYYAMRKTYTYLTPDLWAPTVFTVTPTEAHAEHLRSSKKKL